MGATHKILVEALVGMTDSCSDSNKYNLLAVNIPQGRLSIVPDLNADLVF